MKLHTSTTLLKSSGVMERAQARVNMNAVAFQVLSSRLYSDKEAAPIREIGCNAADAHVMVGTPDRPFDVKLPTVLDPSFSIKDYGPGLSHDDVMQNYQTYFHSTKSDNNDVTGCFGLGSKTPYAYTDQFTVRSVYDGVMRTYFCAFDETGVPCTSLVAEQPAADDWPHGVEVSMPVKYGDQHTFLRKAQAVFQWFRVPPNVVGGEPIRPVQYEWTVGRFRKVSNKWDVEVRVPYLIMGNVAYEFNTSALSSAISTKPEYDWLAPVLNWMWQNDIVFEVPIGTVDVTASRETVEYNEHTNSTLLQLLSEEIKTLAKKIDDYIAGVDAVTTETINGIFDQFGDNVSLGIIKDLSDAVLSRMDQKNKEIYESAMSGTVEVSGWDDAVERAKKAQTCAPHGQRWFWDNDRRRSQSFNGHVPTDGRTIVLVNDRPPRASDRVMALMREDKTKQVLVLGCADKTGWQDIPALLDFNEIPVRYKFVSDLPKPDKMRLGTGMTIRRKGDNKLVGTWDTSTDPVAIPAHGFEPAGISIKDIPDDSRYFVIREAGGWGQRYMSVPGQGRCSWPGSYFKAIYELRKLGFPTPSHIAVVTNGQLDKLKLQEFGFRSLHVWYTDILKKDQRVVDYMSATPLRANITLTTWGAKPLVQALFLALRKKDRMADVIKGRLAGTEFLIELEALVAEWEQADAAVKANDTSKAPDYYAHLAQIGIQCGAARFRSYDFDSKIKALDEKYPRLQAMGRDLIYASGVFDFQMMAVAMAVSPQEPVILTTAEEN